MAEKLEMWLQVQMPDGSWWEVPAKVVADNRASYYAAKEEPGHRTGIYEEEFEFTLKDEYELEDWAANNMNWSEVAKYARRADERTPEVDFQEGWINGEKRRITHPASPDTGADHAD